MKGRGVLTGSFHLSRRYLFTVPRHVQINHQGTRTLTPISDKEERLARAVVDAAHAVPSAPGLLEMP